MPFNPNDPRLIIAQQLALSLAAIYLPAAQFAKLQQGQIVVGALLKAIGDYAARDGRPEGWTPSPEQWDAFRAEQQADIDAEQAKLDQLPPE